MTFETIEHSDVIVFHIENEKIDLFVELRRQTFYDEQSVEYFNEIPKLKQSPPVSSTLISEALSTEEGMPFTGERISVEPGVPP